MAIYLDYAATTPIRDEVLESYVHYLKELGNPSSVHTSGQAVRRALEEARESLAQALDCNRNEVIFTSGGTESNNMAIKGLYWQRREEDEKKNLILSAASEHHAVIDPIEWLAKHDGAEIIWLKIDEAGFIDFDYLTQLLVEQGDRVALISLMWANNETGVVNDIKKLAELAAEYSIPVHSDAVATFGHLPISFKDSSLAAMSVSAHKIGGPIGVGALIVARAAKMVSLIHGGGQERGLRSGPMNAPAAKAFAHAAEIAVRELATEAKRLTQLRDYLISEVQRICPVASLSGDRDQRLPNNAHFIFKGCSGDSLLFLLDQQGISVSTGSACQAGVNGPSHVLIAMGRSEVDAYGCLRMTLGNKSTKEDIDGFIAALPKAVEAALRAGVSITGANR
ncbi:MAG: cysteine desulfurase family protein [Rhodoluna sp.]